MVISRFNTSTSDSVLAAARPPIKCENPAGRTAQLGFLAALIGEKVTGRGILGQLGLETGVPLGAAAFGLVRLQSSIAVFGVVLHAACVVHIMLCKVLLCYYQFQGLNHLPTQPKGWGVRHVGCLPSLYS